MKVCVCRLEGEKEGEEEGEEEKNKLVECPSAGKAVIHSCYFQEKLVPSMYPCVP